MEGGGRSAKYEYRPNANLVLESDRDRRMANEPTGEVESMVGKFGSTKMGDRVARTRPAELDERLAKARVKRERVRTSAEDSAEAAAAAAAAKRSRRGGKDFLSDLADIEGVSYRPKTRETRAVWEQLLSFAQRCLGDQPQEILAGAAEEVIGILKNDAYREPAKKSKVQELLGAVSDEAFSRLTNLGKAVTDFHAGADAAGGGGAAAAAAGAGGVDGGKVDEDIGVAVVFDDLEEEDEGRDEDGAVDELRDEAEDESEAEAEEAAGGGEEVAAAGGGGVGMAQGASAAGGAGGGGDGDDDGGDAEEAAAGLVPVRALDAFWLQRELSRHYDDAQVSQRLAGDVMAILAAGIGAAKTTDVSGMETRLVALLDYGNFDVVKAILRNAARVFYLTRLRRAQTDAERDAVRAEMAADTEAGGPAILARLDRTLTSESWEAARTQAVTARVRKEARELAGANAAAAAAGGAAPEYAAAAGGGGSGGAYFGAAAEEEPEREDVALSGVRTVLPGAGGGARPNYSTGGGATAASGAFVPAAAAAASLPASASSAQQAPARALDLDALAFAAGAHTMSNRRVELPPKSWRSAKKGYEEVHVPPLKPRPLGADERLVPIAELPEWARPAFAKMETLNRVQSRVYRTALFSPENMLLCAPTGAGKTNVAVLAILHELGQHRTGEGGALDLAAFKVVYVAPMKALVQEVVQNLTQRLGAAYGLTVREMSGDVALTKAEVAGTQIIVTTPEKWDVVTRKAGDRAYTQLVRLLILDEVHLLHDERGPVLEALVARTLRGVEASREAVRIVGLSATLPNYEDVATFLRVRPEAGLFYFDNSFRPCPLQQQYIGITEKKAVKRWQLMNDIAYEKAAEQAAAGSQVLVFVHTRKETAKTARALRDAALARDALGSFLREDAAASREILAAEAAASVRDADLKDLLPYGFAIHHAGMARADRALVEDLFADGHVKVLVSTATLAWGVNLPAHTVIIKGTQVYSPEKGRWAELSPLDMVQMLGRAGRPQYDTFGEGIIITGHGELQFYLSLLNQQLPIESQLVARLPDNLNAEVVLGTVTSVREAAAWLGYTYLFVRMLRNPALYGVAPEELARDPLLLQRRLDLAHAAATLLDRHFLVRYDRRSGGLQSTAIGRVASHYYVSHATVATYNDYLKPTLGDIELFRLFSLSSEFKNVVVRQEEKEELRRLLERVPVPVKESMEEPSAKVNVLLQAYISNLRMDGFALTADMVYVQQSAGRLMRALFEICLRRGWAALAQRALTAAKMIDHRQWQSASPLRQFRQAGGGAGGATTLADEVLRRLERKEIAWERYVDMRPADLGELVRMPKAGKDIHRLIHALPRLELAAHVQPLTRSLLRIDVTLTPDFAFSRALHGGGELFWVLVEDADGEAILHHETFLLKAAHAAQAHTVTCYVPVTEPQPPQYFVRVVSDRWLQSEALLPLSFRHLLLPERFPPHTELLDLAPLPIGALRNAAHEALYRPARLSHFNPIQTQVFHALHGTDANALLAAPSGAGKTLAAEFALLRLFGARPDARAVYVVPGAEAARARFDEWDARFGSASPAGLGLGVVELTGELAADLRLAERAHLVIATPQQWDAVSRRWKRRRLVGETALFIMDELEALGATGAAGACYEVVCSRMRFIAMQQQAAAAAAEAAGTAPPPVMRLVGLSLSVANARDLGDWLGAPPSGVFSFHPQVRPVPLEIRLTGFDVPSAGARLLAMARPAYAACAAYAGAAGRPALVFVPSRRQAQLTAVDLVTFAAADGAPLRFLHSAAVPGGMGAADVAAAAAAAGVRDAALLTCLAQGVAFLHEGSRAAERALVARLYAGGVVGVVVASRGAAAGLSTAAWAAHLVVLTGTEGYDGRAHAHVDYPVAEVLHMMGRACRPALAAPAAAAPDGTLALEPGARVVEDTGRCVILCAATRKEYLKRFLYEPLPVESALHTALHDHLNSEVVNRVVQTKHDALDYLTWTFLYRRLPQNPNFYNLQGTSHAHLSDYLSDLLDTTLGDLAAAQCLAITDEVNLAPLNVGMIAAYYYTAYTTLEVFASSLAARTKTKGLLEIVCAASEFEVLLPVRQGEERALRQLAMHVPLAMPAPAATATAGGASDAAPASDDLYSDVHIKANILLQCHFSRRALGSGELRSDQARVLEAALPLLQAAVDVVSSEGWLKPALAAMELSQMVVQGLWASRDSALLQAPHLSPADADALEHPPEGSGAAPVESVYDLIAMEPAARAAALGRLGPAELGDVAAFCNRYPNVDVAFVVGGGGAAVHTVGAVVPFTVTLTREAGTEGMDEGAGLGAVVAPLFPRPKAEGWWLVVGDAARNAILAIKRIALPAAATAVKLDFPAPAEPGAHALTLYFMCDSYLGCDQEYAFTLRTEAEAAPEAEEAAAPAAGAMAVDA